MSYSCHNRPPLHNFDWPGRAPIPFVMSINCEYTKSALGQVDKGCDGCEHKKPTATANNTFNAITFVANEKQLEAI